MTTSERILNLLRQNNPLVAAITGHSWEANDLAILASQQEAQQGIQALMGQLVNQPFLRLGGLVRGEVGSGKTHLIRHLRRMGQEPPSGFGVTPLPPIGNTRQPLSHLLREIANSLGHPLEAMAGISGWQRLLRQLLLLWQTEEPPEDGKVTSPWRRLRQHPAAFFARKAHRAWLRTRLPSLLDWLERQLPGGNLAIMRTIILAATGGKQGRATREWLQGGILDSKKLPSWDFNGLAVSDAEQEEEARQILVTMGAILGFCRLPLMVCFDQMENLRDPEQRLAFEAMTQMLLEQTDAILPVAFVRGSSWEKILRPNLPSHIAEGLMAHTFDLACCSREEAVVLVNNRMQSVLGADWSRYAPFSADRLLDRLPEGGLTPRAVLLLANQRLQAWLEKMPHPEATPEQRLEEAWSQEYRHLIDFSKQEPPRPDHLRLALRLWLTHRPHEGHWSLSEEPETGDLILRSDDGFIREVWIVDGERSHLRTGVNLRRAAQYLQKVPIVVVSYVRDGRNSIPPLSEWGEAKRLKQEFRQSGGQFIRFKFPDLARWYALTRLAFAVREGDVCLADPDGRERAVTWDEFATFLRQRLLGVLRSASDQADS